MDMTKTFPKIRRAGYMVSREGKREKFTIGEYILLRQSSAKHKVFVLEELIFDSGIRQLRLGYYMLGRKGNMKNKWVWGQYCPFIPKKDFNKLYEMAKKKGLL